MDLLTDWAPPPQLGETHTVFCSAMSPASSSLCFPCEHNNFLIVLNFTFKFELCIDHIKVSDELENW